MLLSPSAMHALNERDSHPVHQSHTRSLAQCRYRSAKCHNRGVTHLRCASLTQEAGALLPSALQPNAAVTEGHARSTQA